MLEKIYKPFLKIFFLTVLLFQSAIQVYSAALTVSPTQIQTTVGQTVRFQVMVNTQSVAINAIDGIISYDPNTLEVTSVSRSGSALNIWIEEPNFSNTTGKISFAGGVATPGYTGSSGLVFSITAKAKKTGSATFDLNNVSIRQNDGEGTEVVTAVNDSVVTVAKASVQAVKDVEVKEPVKEVVKTQAPVAQVFISKPDLTSSTHPNQDAWFNSKEVVVSWAKNINASGVQIIFDSKPDTVATGPVQYGVSQKILRGVRDGISYLHVRYVGKNSVSETAHYAVRVDTIAPTDILISAKNEGDNLRILEISAVDAHSGPAFADISMAGESAVRVPFKEGKAIYSVPDTYQGGKQNVVVDVYDLANNKTSIIQEVELKDVPKVQITVLHKKIKVGESVQVSGKTSKILGDIFVTVQAPSQKIETYLVKSDELGNLGFKIPFTEAGTYKVWANAEVQDISDSETVEVYQTLFGSINSWIYRNNWIYGLIFILAAFILFIVYLTTCRKKKKIISHIDDMHLEEKIDNASKLIKEEAVRYIVYLQKIAEIRSLTKEEKNMYTLCQKILK